MTGKRTFRVALAVAALALALAGAGAAQGPGAGAPYVFRGHLLATPPANATSISVEVEGGNRLALKKMLGSSVDQTFTVGTGTEFLKWSNGIPTVVHSNDLAAGDWVIVHVRAPRGRDPRRDRVAAGRHRRRPREGADAAGQAALPLPRHARVAGGRELGDASTSRGGNRHALRLLIGAGRQQTFSVRPGHDLPALAGQGADGDLAGAAEVGDRVDRADPRGEGVDALPGRVDAGSARRRARAGEREVSASSGPEERGGRRAAGGLHALRVSYIGARRPSSLAARMSRMRRLLGTRCCGDDGRRARARAERRGGRPGLARQLLLRAEARARRGRHERGRRDPRLPRRPRQASARSRRAA